MVCYNIGCYTILLYTVLYCTVLIYTLLYYTVPKHTTLYYNTLYSSYKRCRRPSQSTTWCPVGRAANHSTAYKGSGDTSASQEQVNLIEEASQGFKNYLSTATPRYQKGKIVGMNAPQAHGVPLPNDQNSENGANAVEGFAHFFALAKKVFVSLLRGAALSRIVV